MSESPDDTQAPLDTNSSLVDETGHSHTQTNSTGDAWHKNVTLLSAIWAATIGILGNAAVMFIESKENLALERIRLQQQLLINSVQGNDINVVKNNIRFLIETGMLQESKLINISAIEEYLEQNDPIMVPSPVGVSHSCALTAEGKVQCWGSTESGQLGLLNPSD